MDLGWRQILSRIDHDEAVEWLRTAIQTPSVTGSEGPLGELLAEEFRRLGAEVHTHEVAPGRPIVWTRTPGRGRGTVMVIGHLDTVPRPPVRDEWKGTEHEDPYSAAVVDGEVWGLGSVDVKGGIAAVRAALRAMAMAKIQPAGDVICVFVPDEESGVEGTGRSIGIRAVMQMILDGTIPRPDFAIYVEPTQLEIYFTQIGFAIAEINLQGASAYFSDKAKGADALRCGYQVLGNLYALEDALSEREPNDVLGPPALLVHGFSAGSPTPAVAARGQIHLIRSVIPGEDMAVVVEEITTAVAQAHMPRGTSASVAFPATRDHEYGGEPMETNRESPAVLALARALAAVEPSMTNPLRGAPYYSELTFLAKKGIPGVYFAGGDIRTCHQDEERLPLGEFKVAIETLTLFLVTGFDAE